MTTDAFEHDLKSFAAPRPGDEQLRTAIRDTLGEHVQLRVPDRRRRRVLLGGGAIAAATAAVAIVALVGAGGSGGPSSADAAILARVAGAITAPADMIVHVRETGVLSDGTEVGVEWWQETSAPHAIRLIKGPVGREVEGAADGTTSSQYDAATNTIYQRPDSKLPPLVDPVESVRAALAGGTGQVAGTVTIDGRSLYQVELPNGVVAYFDRSDYRPVYIDNPQGGGGVVRTRVTAYEELAVTSASRQLLSIAAQHPGASVAAGAAPASSGEGKR
jgi:hypothetical protein